MKLSVIRFVHTPETFYSAFWICKNNPILGYKLGYSCNSHMTPEQFIKMNDIELVELDERELCL